MDYLMIAYILIAVTLVGYFLNLRQRMLTVQREREQLETKDR